MTWTPTNDLHKLLVAQCILIYHSVVKVEKISGLSILKLSFKVRSICIIICFYKSNDICLQNAKQKHLGWEKVQGQSEATLQTGSRSQKI